MLDSAVSNSQKKQKTKKTWKCRAGANIATKKKATTSLFAEIRSCCFPGRFKARNTSELSPLPFLTSNGFMYWQGRHPPNQKIITIIYQTICVYTGPNYIKLYYFTTPERRGFPFLPFGVRSCEVAIIWPYISSNHQGKKLFLWIPFNFKMHFSTPCARFLIAFLHPGNNWFFSCLERSPAHGCNKDPSI